MTRCIQSWYRDQDRSIRVSIRPFEHHLITWCPLNASQTPSSRFSTYLPRPYSSSSLIRSSAIARPYPPRPGSYSSLYSSRTWPPDLPRLTGFDQCTEPQQRLFSIPILPPFLEPWIHICSDYPFIELCPPYVFHTIEGILMSVVFDEAKPARRLCETVESHYQSLDLSTPAAYH